MDEHICELLFDHDCVIVPQLGGFLASYAGSTLHPVHHTLYPPARKVAFNVFLKQNDGLLAHHLSQAERLSYAEALRKVELYASSCLADLNQGRRVHIAGVGTLFPDSERNLQFEPDPSANFLHDSYGLSPIRHLPLEPEEKKTERQLKELVTIRPSVRAERKPLKSTSKKVMSRVLVAGAVVWMGVNLFLVLKDNKSVTAWMHEPPPRDAQKEQPAAANTTEAAMPLAVPTETTAAILSLPESSSVEETVNPSSQETAMASVAPSNAAVKEITAPAPAPTVAVATTADANYFVIAGAFKISSNAESLVEDLHRKGFSNAKILSSDHPLTLVCYDGYASRREANKALDSLRDGTHEGWVFKGSKF